jgi:hypothetical protein
LPYCKKCGVELDEAARFCQECGTSIDITTPKPEKIKVIVKKPTKTIAIILIIIIISAAVLITFAFSPILSRDLDVKESRDVDYQTGVNTILLDFTTDIGQVNVLFEDLPDKALALNLSMEGKVRTGLFSTDIYELTFEPTVSDNILTVESEFDIRTQITYVNLNVTCNIRIDPVMNASIVVKSSTGGIMMETEAGVTLNMISLETTTGGVKANFVEEVEASGDISITATTGSVEMNWENVIATKDASIDIMSSTGSIYVDIVQDVMLPKNVTFQIETTTGGIDFNVDIRENVGTKITSSVVTGNVEINQQIGFSGTEDLLQSNNYPSLSNFEVNLMVTTGGIDIRAKYIP